MPLLVIILLAATALGTGCGTEGGDGLPPTATLGTGSDQFEPLSDGDDIYVVQGPQGGFHVFGSVQVTGIVAGDPNDLQSPDNPTTEFQVTSGGNRIDAMASRYTQGLEPAGDVDEMVGRLVILDILADDELDGVDIVLSVTVTCVNGVTVSDSRALTARPFPGNP